MSKCAITIRQPNDSGKFWTTSISCETFNFGTAKAISPNRSAKDPVQDALEDFWKGKIRYSNNYWKSTFSSTFSHLVFVGKLPIQLTKESTRYSMNGKVMNLNAIVSALARVTFKSCFEEDPVKLMMYLHSSTELPENVKYCLENRVPYHWYELTESTNKIEVRLNVQQISDKEIAIEVSDGIWGTMTIKDLDVFCNFYRDGHQRGSWKNTSPLELYYRTVGKMPTDSDMKVMKAFLKQNRTQKIVEERAIQLVNELLEQYPDRLFADWNGNELKSIIVKGKEYDWKLTNNDYKSDIQQVSTFVWQPRYETNEETGEREVSTVKWNGPICIDNMAKGSSLGDQFAARALALLNDSFTIKIVSTIRRYLTANANEYRVDVDDEM